jgi:hypothetical protein
VIANKFRSDMSTEKEETEEGKIYRMSIKSFSDYKHLLQENYSTWNTNIFFSRG